MDKVAPTMRKFGEYIAKTQAVLRRTGCGQKTFQGPSSAVRGPLLVGGPQGALGPLAVVRS